MKNATPQLLDLVQREKLSPEEVLDFALSFLARKGLGDDFAGYAVRAVKNRTEAPKSEPKPGVKKCGQP